MEILGLYNLTRGFTLHSSLGLDTQVRDSLAHCQRIEAHNLGPPVWSSIPCK